MAQIGHKWGGGSDFLGIKICIYNNCLRKKYYFSEINAIIKNIFKLILCANANDG